LPIATPVHSIASHLAHPSGTASDGFGNAAMNQATASEDPEGRQFRASRDEGRVLFDSAYVLNGSKLQHRKRHAGQESWGNARHGLPPFEGPARRIIGNNVQWEDGTW